MMDYVDALVWTRDHKAQIVGDAERGSQEAQAVIDVHRMLVRHSDPATIGVFLGALDTYRRSPKPERDPTAMTLEEALRAIAHVRGTTLAYHEGDGGPDDPSGWVEAETGTLLGDYRRWEDAASHALGYPVVERDPAAELVEAVEAWAKAYSRAYDEPLDPSEVDDAVWQFDRAEADLLAALARYRGEP